MNSDSTIWVVDDERSIRWVLDKALTQAGMAVTCYENSASLLADLGHNTPDAIVSDIRMPGMDGLELLDKIQLSHPEIPVIIMTAHSDLDSAVSSIKGGAFEYIPKPFEVDEAVAVVKRAIDHRKPTESAAPTVEESVDSEISKDTISGIFITAQRTLSSIFC